MIESLEESSSGYLTMSTMSPPKYNHRRQIEWKRFWCPLGSGISFENDGRGFLEDPEGKYSAGRNPKVRELHQLIPDVGPLILCGDPGIGKTNEFQRLKSYFQKDDNGNRVLALTFRLHISNIQEFRQRTIESPAWQTWKDGDKHLTLMIDGVDEGLIRIPTFISALRGILEEEPIGRLRVILTCRSAEWPEIQGEALLFLWPRLEDSPKPIYELCPLRFKDVKLAAEVWDIDSAKLAESIWRSQAVGLATRPVTLFMLLDEFLNHRNLPSSHRELYHKGALKLVGEVDPERLEILRSTRGPLTGATIAERFNAAKRLAALLLCCGQRAIIREESSGNMVDENMLVLTQAFPNGTSPSAAACIEAVESALFTSVGPERFGFAHQTFAECLGSMQLGELPLSQVRRLLMQIDEAGEHVVPQLTELAAWTAGSHKHFCEHLLQIDPTALLHCDASVLSDDMKYQLVEAMLSGVKAERILDDHRFYRFFHTLRHPDIVAQLRPYIVDKEDVSDSRSVAIEIAERCMLSELTDDLFSILTEETGSLRENAAGALCEVIPATRLAELEPLARGKVEGDGKQSILGYALKRLIPERWSVTEALPYIQPTKTTGHYGSYRRFLDSHLPNHLKIEDLPSALEWIRLNLGVFDSHSARNPFAQRIIDLALQQLESINIARLFSQLWGDLAAQYLTHELATTFGLKERFAKDTDLRHKVVSLLLNSNWPADLHVCNLFDELNIVGTPDEFGWYLEQARSAPPLFQDSWAAMIEMHAHNPKLLAPYWDEFLSCLTVVPALQQRFEWLRSWELSEPMARQSKARFLRDKRRRKRLERRRKSRRQDPQAARENALQLGREDAIHAWWPLWHALHWGNDSSDPTCFSRMDVESFKGWQLLSSDEQKLARFCAREFLLKFPDDTSSWEPGSDCSINSTSAIWLLKDSLEKEQDLARAVSDRWIRLFSGFHFNDDAGEAEVFSLIDRVDHCGALAAMMADIERYRPQIKRPFAIRAAKRCWDHRYDLAMQQYADSLTDPQTIYETIDEWRDLSAEAAGNYAFRRLLVVMAEAKETYPICFKVVICAALLSRPIEAFQQLEGILEKDEALAESIWSLVFHDIDTQRGPWWSAWSEEHMADLYLHLNRVLPRSGDPYHDVGFIAPRTSAAWARDQIPNKITDRSSRESCHALSRLIRELPDRAPSLRWSYHKALAQWRRNVWSPPDVAETLKLINNANSRLIGSDQDLLEAVLESIERFQHHLTDTTLPAVEGLWNRLPVEGSRTRHLQPKDEKALQQDLARWLRDDMEASRGIIANCEVEPRLGSFTDIWINALRQGRQQEFEKITVVIEVKGCWHSKVRTAMHTQLVDGYLRPNSLIAGIYLVGWFVCDACPDAVNCTGLGTIEEAKSWFSNEVARYNGKAESEIVNCVILDCRWPHTSPSQNTK